MLAPFVYLSALARGQALHAQTVLAANRGFAAAELRVEGLPPRQGYL